ncbi:MAG: hypothetical protein M1816_003095 [Peltula sp. TS41687]|nr:MAG: hypothetical protein M1816_003095 [Peltula sp. TS41687]
MGKLKKITLGAAAAAPFDPTGTMLAVALGSGAALTTRSAWRKVAGSSDPSDESDGPEAVGNLTYPANTVVTNQKNIDDIVRLRQIVRSITASTIGLTTSTALSTTLPYHIIPATINAGVLIKYIHELHALATKAGGKGALIRSIRTHQLVADVAIATVLKIIFLILFLGHDFEVMANAMAHSSELILAHTDTGVTPLVEQLPGSEVAEWHAAVSAHGVLPWTQGLVDALPEAVQEGMIGTDDPAVWGSEAAHRMGLEGILLVGTVIAGVDQGVRIAMEDPSVKLVGRMQHS